MRFLWEGSLAGSFPSGARPPRGLGDQPHDGRWGSAPLPERRWWRSLSPRPSAVRLVAPPAGLKGIRGAVWIQPLIEAILQSQNVEFQPQKVIQDSLKRTHKFQASCLWSRRCISVCPKATPDRVSQSPFTPTHLAKQPGSPLLGCSCRCPKTASGGGHQHPG